MQPLRLASVAIYSLSFFEVHMSTNTLSFHITDPTTITDFLLAGRAVFTLKSKKTDRHYTYRVSRKKDDGKQATSLLWFVSLMTAPDHFSYIGILGARGSGDVPLFRTTKATQNPDSPM